MVAGAELWGVPDRDATLDSFITPDAETDGTEDGADTDQEAEATVVESSEAESEEAEPKKAEPEKAEAEGTETGEADSVETEEADDSSGGEREADPVTEAAETMFSWSPDATACEACGDQTQRRWRTDAGFVCPDCVDWERGPAH